MHFPFVAIYESNQISTYAVSEVTKYLLSQGVKFVLTNRINQQKQAPEMFYEKSCS